MTVEEFWAFGRQSFNAGKAFDLIRGDVVEWPRPFLKHGVVCAQIGAALVGALRRDGSGFVTTANAGVILARDPATVIGPDLALFTEHRSEDSLAGWSLGPPTLAVEVLSPDDNAHQVGRKIEAHLVNGVRTVWVVDYDLREVVVHRPAGPLVTRYGDDELTHHELPTLSARVADFFRLPAERRRAAT